LLGHEIMRFTDCLGLSPQRVDLYAEAGQQIAQPLVEEVLRETVADLQTCQLCLGWSLRSLQQFDDHVQAILVNTQGEQRSIEASYVLGCDCDRVAWPGTRRILRRSAASCATRSARRLARCACGLGESGRLSLIGFAARKRPG
jgi:2-polyprenyl-6-methoxyphenol hydroxylase-like FAD-dependent oxidoreductase